MYHRAGAKLTNESTLVTLLPCLGFFRPMDGVFGLLEATASSESLRGTAFSSEEVTNIPGTKRKDILLR